MRKVVWLTVLMICLAVVPAYAAHWEEFKIPMKEEPDALIEEFYDRDRITLLTNEDKDKICCYYFWKKKFYNRPETGQGEREYDIYWCMLDVRKKEWRIREKLMYTKLLWAPAVYHKNTQWEDRGPVDHNHRDNSQKAVQITQRADVLMRSNRLKIRDIPVNPHALPIPEDMK